MTSDTTTATGERPVLKTRLRLWMAVAVIVSTVAMGIVGYALAGTLAPSHVANVDLLVLPNEQGLIDEALVRTFESVLDAEAFAADVQRISTDPNVEQLTPDEVASSIVTTRSPTSSLIEVQVTRSDPETAVAIADAIAPAVDQLLTVGGIEASALYQQVFPEPLVQEKTALPRALAAGIGAVVGFLMGVTAVLLWSVRRPVVMTSQQVEELAGYPIISRLPRRIGRWRRSQLNTLDPLAAAVGQVRDTGVTSKGGVVAVVAPEVDASVSFTMEFASLLAQTGEGRVFLLDGDFRRAELTRRLEADDLPGWDQLDLADGTEVEAEVLDSLRPLPSTGDAESSWPSPFLVPASRGDAQDDRASVERLRLVLETLSGAGVVVVACPTVPGDVPAVPAIAAASAVLIVARLGVTAPDDMTLVGELVASLSDAPSGVVVIEA